MKNSKDIQLLKHILEYCKEVEQSVDRIKNVENLASDYFNRNALAMSLVQIGELVRILSDDFKNSHQNIPWRKISGLRNHIIHGYGEIDWDMMWDTSIDDIPNFNEECKSFLLELTSVTSKGFSR